MKRLCKKMTVLSVVIAVFIISTISASADYLAGSGFAGSTSVYCEGGFNGTTAYAYVSAGDYVDARISGRVIYEDGSTKTMYKTFDQNTYGEVTVKNNQTVSRLICSFYVSSEDGSYKFDMTAEKS